MSRLNRKVLVTSLMLSVLAMHLSAGCGTRVGKDGQETPSPYPTTPPASESPNIPPIGPSPSLPPIPSPPAVELQIAKKEFKSQPLGWFAKPWIEVMVTNPGGTIKLTGTVQISFTKKGTPTGDEQNKSVSLGPNETQTLKFTAAKSNPDDATYTVTTNPPSGIAN